MAEIETYSKVMMLIFAVFLIIASGCSKENSSLPYQEADLNIANPERDIRIDRLEIIHFHGNSQCYSCIKVGEYAKDTVNTYFSEELESGIIEFSHINAQAPENAGIAGKYGVTGSSLWLGVYTGEEFHKENNINVWYRISDRQKYMEYLKGVIEKKLRGDLS